MTGIKVIAERTHERARTHVASFGIRDRTMLLLDGGKYSGSGTIVRFGVALAALTGRELRLTNIRARRYHPGLRPQHVTAVQAVRSLCCGSLEMASVGSGELVFSPGPLPQGGSFQWDIGTAGSTTMLAMSILPIAAFASQPCAFRLTGGLFQDFAPSAFHVEHALLPLLGRMGLKAELRILQPGYVPKGGGAVQLHVQPVQGSLMPLVLLEWGSLRKLWGIALSSHLQQRRVSDRMAERCQQTLDRRGLKADINIVYDEAAIQPGASLALFAETTGGAILGADQAGAPRRRAESIGEFVGHTMLEEMDSGATVDRHLADQLIIFAALAEGTSEFLIPRLTEHIQTNLWLVETILGAQTRLEGQRVCIRGIGYMRRC